jgi:hypothetical protein
MTGRFDRSIVCTLYRSRWALMNSYAERTRPALDCVDISFAPPLLGGY